MVRYLYRPADAAILIYFRFFAGVFLSVELINSLNLGDFKEYTKPALHFSYLYFDWIKPWPYEGMILHYGVTILAGFFLALGIYQRLSALVLFLGYTSLFLMEKSEYINHFYLYCLISFWLIWLPDMKGKKVKAPVWIYYLLLFHLGLVYFYAGLAKFHDDWLNGTMVSLFIKNRPDHFLSSFYQFPGMTKAFTYGGLLFDLLIVPFLMIPKTRIIAFILAILFHLSNVVMFGLATFPWFSLMMTAMFFGMSWPRKFKWFDDFFPEPDFTPVKTNSAHKVVTGLVILYCLFHLLIPLRHFLYPGDPSWTEDGHQFSWRMKLRSKSGQTVFYVVDKVSKKINVVFPRSFLTEKQNRDLNGKPDSILQFAHFLKNRFGNVSVYSSSQVSLNGRPPIEMIRRDVDLAQEERKIGPYTWINR